MRLFGSDRIVKVMERVGSKKARSWKHPLLTAPSRPPQKRSEQHNFQNRKRTLEYETLLNKQREVYCLRNEIIHGSDVKGDRLMRPHGGVVHSATSR